MLKVTDTSLKLATIFRSLKYRNYRLFFAGQSVSLIGTWMQRIAMPWLVYHMTGSELLLGVVSFAGQIPTFLLAPFAGVVTDRFSKYRVLIITQVVSLVQALILAILTLTGSIDLWQIVVLSIILGCVNAFDVPTRHSFVVEMVDNREDLGNAIALNSLMFNGARLIGPSVAGLLLAITSEGVCFLINAISYVFVVGSLMMMTAGKQKGAGSKSHILKDLNDGLKYAFGFPPIRHLLLLLTVVSLTGMSYQVLMPVFAKDILQGGSQTYGFLMGAAGLGALAGAVFLASRTTVLRLGRLVPASTLLFGAGLIIISFSRIFSVSVLLMVVIGAGMMLQSAASNTILQTITDDDKRGRVMSLYTMAVMGTAPFGSLLSGAMAKTIGTPYTVLIFGIITIISALFFLRKLPELRELVRPIYVRLGIIREVAEGIQKSEEIPGT
ncbi:MAG TPA: MFS transporter [Bacteroidales bacterium]|nr:MFS transporter [Bacteroidales bacterium]